MEKYSYCKKVRKHYIRNNIDKVEKYFNKYNLNDDAFDENVYISAFLNGSIDVLVWSAQRGIDIGKIFQFYHLILVCREKWGLEAIYKLYVCDILFDNVVNNILKYLVFKKNYNLVEKFIYMIDMAPQTYIEILNVVFHEKDIKFFKIFVDYLDRDDFNNMFDKLKDISIVTNNFNFVDYLEHKLNCFY